MVPIAGKRKANGFTLIELVITVAVAVVLATVAVPGFQGLVMNNRQVADFNEILAGINYGRSEAVKRRQPVSIAITDNGGVWRLEVLHSGNVIREIVARHDRTSVTGKSIQFNSLGRRSFCLDESGSFDDECAITVGDGFGDIIIHPSGRIERRPN